MSGIGGMMGMREDRADERNETAGDGGRVWEDHTREIIGCIIEVHRELGPGFLEIIYRRALAIELGLRGLATESEKSVLIHYKNRRIGRHLIDLVVENQVIVELKTSEGLGKAHYAQVRSYLAATGLPTALLVNFAGPLADYRRVDAVHRADSIVATPSPAARAGSHQLP